MTPQAFSMPLWVLAALALVVGFFFGLGQQLAQRVLP